MYLKHAQNEVREWANRNFGDVPSWQPLLGIVEELGELAHAHLKREQKIRGSAEEHRIAQLDAVGDIMVYMMDYCSREGIDLEDCTAAVWIQVKQRDWKANPVNGSATEVSPGMRLRAERQRVGLSVSAAADIIHITDEYLVNIEDGVKPYNELVGNRLLNYCEKIR